MKPSIVCVDRSLTPDDFRAVSEFAMDAAYTYGEEDEEGQKPTGMVCELDPECDEDDSTYEMLEQYEYEQNQKDFYTDLCK